MDLLEKLKCEFSKWRSNRVKGREKIPEELMRLSAECAYKYGKHIVIKEIGLCGYRLSDAMLNYKNENICIENKGEVKQKENNLVKEIEFQEVSVKKNDSVIANENKVIQETIHKSSLHEDKIFLPDKENKQEVLFEVESNLGFRIKVFSGLESVHRNLITCFLNLRC